MKILQCISSAAPVAKDHKELANIVSHLRGLGHKIVLTQGVWDMVHPGHTRYLAKAKAQGTFLIVAIDCDALVRFRKGPGKPFDPEKERMDIIRALRCVDMVILRKMTKNKMDTLQAVRPDVFVISETTGPEVQDEILKFKKYARKVVNFKPQSSNSTTAKMRKMRNGVFREFKDGILSLLDSFEVKINGESSAKEVAPKPVRSSAKKSAKKTGKK